jgi:putative ABC transport system permease protein
VIPYGQKSRSQTELPEEFVMGSGLLSSVAPYVQSSFEASLIPAIDSLRSLAIVWIPGLMAGMPLSGARPAYAAIYQFVVLAMSFASSGLTSSTNNCLTRLTQEKRVSRYPSADENG